MIQCIPISRIAPVRPILRSNDIVPLTILRGVAAYMVVFSHCLRVGEARYFGESQPMGWAPWPIDLGSFGVLLFFALSGFTLHLSYGRERQSIKSVGAYLARRFARIYPAFVCSAAAYLILDWIVRSLIGFHGSEWIAEFSEIVPHGVV
jgi:peptidoglycan/LPS O-acetylase OafA/YrhL